MLHHVIQSTQNMELNCPAGHGAIDSLQQSRASEIKACLCTRPLVIEQSLILRGGDAGVCEGAHAGLLELVDGGALCRVARKEAQHACLEDP